MSTRKPPPPKMFGRLLNWDELDTINVIHTKFQYGGRFLLRDESCTIARMMLSPNDHDPRDKAHSKLFDALEDPESEICKLQISEERQQSLLAEIEKHYRKMLREDKSARRRTALLEGITGERILPKIQYQWSMWNRPKNLLAEYWQFIPVYIIANYGKKEDGADLDDYLRLINAQECVFNNVSGDPKFVKRVTQPVEGKEFQELRNFVVKHEVQLLVNTQNHFINPVGNKISVISMLPLSGANTVATTSLGRLTLGAPTLPSNLLTGPGTELMTDEQRRRHVEWESRAAVTPRFEFEGTHSVSADGSAQTWYSEPEQYESTDHGGLVSSAPIGQPSIPHIPYTYRENYLPPGQPRGLFPPVERVIIGGNKEPHVAPLPGAAPIVPSRVTRSSESEDEDEDTQLPDSGKSKSKEGEQSSEKRKGESDRDKPRKHGSKGGNGSKGEEKGGKKRKESRQEGGRKQRGRS